jgi:site-specific DNA-methyltransferase (adenine-specific)
MVEQTTQNKEAFEFLKDVKDNSVDLIIIDPPYSTPVITSFGRKKVKNLADLSIQEYFFTGLKKEFERVLKENGRLFVFCDDKFYPVLFAVFYDWLNLQLLIWDKGKIGMGKPIRKQHELILYANRASWEFNKEELTHIPSVIKVKSEKEKYHGAQKPLEILKTIIYGFSKEGDLVLDCFSGSGNTAIASKELQRNFIGCDLNSNYVKIANKRLEQETITNLISS